MRYCTKCVQPDTRPGIYFNAEGVCGGCLFEEDSKNNINWSARKRELKGIAQWAKKVTKSAYDCVVGVSGGKDSTFQALYARDVLKLRVLLVNSEPEGITPIGAKNIENLINQGFDCIKLRPNPLLMKKMMKRDFYKFLNPVKIMEYSLYASSYIIADKFNIPLIIQGENAGLTLGVSKTGVGVDGNALNANKLNTLSEDWRNYLCKGISEKDLFLFHYDREKLSRKGIKGIWLQYYVKEWSPYHNAKFSIEHGLTVRPIGHNPEAIGTYGNTYQLDSDLVQVNQLFKCIKFGFGQATDHACYDIREGRIDRNQGIALIRSFDGLCSDVYIENFCNYIGITVDEFWKIANTFRGSMWKKEEGTWVLIDPIWEQTTYHFYSVYKLSRFLAVKKLNG